MVYHARMETSHSDWFAQAGVQDVCLIGKRVLPVVLLALFWCWETWRPFFGAPGGRWRHAARNLALGLLNNVVLALAFGAGTLMVAEWTARQQLGLLNVLDMNAALRFASALILLDGLMYLWHRANHQVPLLWRFHRMHHSDPAMDVTTATRFHLGEHVGAAVLRLALIPLLGFDIWHLVVYDSLLLAVILFHHADISLGAFDPWLRLVIVTPDMHKVHHSDRREETDSNFATVLSLWDRIAGTFRLRADPRTITFGLPEYGDPAWQTLAGMLETPFVDARQQEDGERDTMKPMIVPRSRGERERETINQVTP